MRVFNEVSQNKRKNSLPFTCHKALYTHADGYNPISVFETDSTDKMMLSSVIPLFSVIATLGHPYTPIQTTDGSSRCHYYLSGSDSSLSVLNGSAITGCGPSRPAYYRSGPIDLELRRIRGTITGQAAFVSKPGDYELTIQSNINYIYQMSVVQEYIPPRGSWRNETLVHRHPILINRAAVWFNIPREGFIFYKFTYHLASPHNTRMVGTWNLKSINNA